MMSLNDLSADQVKLIVEKLDWHFNSEAMVARTLCNELGGDSRAYLDAQDKCREIFVVRAALNRHWLEMMQVEEVRRRSGAV